MIQDIAIGDRRFKFLEVCLGDSPDDLETLKEGVALAPSRLTQDALQAVAEAFEADAQAVADNPRQQELGTAPPCTSYMALTLVKDIGAASYRFNDCSSEKAMKTLLDNESSKAKPFNDLIASCKKAITSVRKALRFVQGGENTPKKARAGGAAAVQGGGKGGKEQAKVGNIAASVQEVVPGMLLFESAPAHATEIAVLTLENIATADFSLPFMVRLDACDKADFVGSLQEGPLHAAMDNFVTDWKRDLANKAKSDGKASSKFWRESHYGTRA